MLISNTILIAILCIILILVGIPTYFAIRFALIILRTQEAVEDSLDTLDETYTHISTILDRPLFYDSPEIRGVLNDIRRARTSIFSVANVLTKIDNPEEPEPPLSVDQDI